MQALGGYYRDMSGPMSDDGVGFNAGGGVNFEVADNTTVGLFGNYNYMNLVAAPHSDVARQLVVYAQRPSGRGHRGQPLPGHVDLAAAHDRVRR